jgi:nucleotide-binding universal stress UspA family protein
MLQRILVPLDGTPLAEEALPLAAQLARVTSTELFLLKIVTQSSQSSIVPVGPPFLMERVREADLAAARTYLAQVITYEHLDGIRVHAEAWEGSPVQSILHYAQIRQVDLVVMRSHGDVGLKRWLLGSVAQQFIRHSPIPVLILRSGSLASGKNLATLKHSPRILVTLDGSALAEAALLPAAQLVAALAGTERGAVHLMYTVPHLVLKSGEAEEYVDRINKEARTEAQAYLKNIEHRFLTGDFAPFHLRVTTSVMSHFDAADIWKRVVEECECADGTSSSDAGCDIIAMATHGRSGLRHFIEGSVTEQVFDAAQRPLLVVHTQSAEESVSALPEARYV